MPPWGPPQTLSSYHKHTETKHTIFIISLGLCWKWAVEMSGITMNAATKRGVWYLVSSLYVNSPPWLHAACYEGGKYLFWSEAWVRAGCFSGHLLLWPGSRCCLYFPSLMLATTGSCSAVKMVPRNMLWICGYVCSSVMCLELMTEPLSLFPCLCIVFVVQV